MSTKAETRLLVVADQLLDKLLDHNLQFAQQTGAGQIVDDMMTEIRRLSSELAECKAAYESQFKELHALKASIGEPVAYMMGTGLYWPDDAPTGDENCEPLYAIKDSQP